MIAHVAFPALTHDNALPATLSSAFIQGLLREKMGYEGVILSDCLEMQAISDTFGTESSAVMALQAGIDLALVSHHAALQQGSLAAIREAVLTGDLSAQVIQRAAERVVSLKARYPSWDEASVDVDYAAHERLRDRAYELSSTLVRNEDALLPVRSGSGERIVVVSPPRNTMTKVEDRFYSDEMLLDILRGYTDDVSLVAVASAGDYGELLQKTSEQDIVIVATVNAHLDEEQANVMRFLIDNGRRVIGIAVRNPYDLQAFPRLRTFLATYEYTRPGLLAAVRVIFGEREARGRLPVSVSV
jgi:beta-N-acetylhexosaminidase